MCQHIVRHFYSVFIGLRHGIPQYIAFFHSIVQIMELHEHQHIAPILHFNCPMVLNIRYD
jgi:hypothetical protein